MPVANCFERFRIGIQRLQLDQRHGLLVLAMADKHEHFTPFAFFLRGHAEYRDLIAYLQRGNRPSGDAPGFEGEIKVILEIIIPAHGLFVFAVTIDDDFHANSIIAFGI